MINPHRRVFYFLPLAEPVHDAVDDRKAAYRSASPFTVINPLRRVFYFLSLAEPVHDAVDDRKAA
ncbi:MAG TPA: hypothetical protein DEF05_01955, partial [Erwinia sp.]|nr:hypothetical protein [Erwinia sp.]